MAGPHPQSFLFSVSGVGLRICFSNTFPGDGAIAAVQGPQAEKHWSRSCQLFSNMVTPPPPPLGWLPEYLCSRASLYTHSTVTLDKPFPGYFSKLSNERSIPKVCTKVQEAKDMICLCCHEAPLSYMSNRLLYPLARVTEWLLLRERAFSSCR